MGSPRERSKDDVRITAYKMGAAMKNVIFVLVLSLVAQSSLLAQESAGPRVPHQIYNCCIKSLALDAPAECKKMTGLDCQNMGGKIVKDCKECK